MPDWCVSNRNVLCASFSSRLLVEKATKLNLKLVLTDFNRLKSQISKAANGPLSKTSVTQTVYWKKHLFLVTIFLASANIFNLADSFIQSNLPLQL